jgi:hypothetical protein
MSIPVFTCLVLGALLALGGGYIVTWGRAQLAEIGAFSEQDVRALGVIHIIVGCWFLLGGVIDDPNTTMSACTLMTKVRYCMASL